MKALLTFAASLMGLVLFGAFAAFGGAAGKDDKAAADGGKKKKGLVVAAALFVVPDAYTTVPGTSIDAAQLQGPATFGKITELSVESTASLFGATVKLQGSDDNVTFVDLTTATQAGAANIIDVVNAVGTTVALVVNAGLAAGQAALAFRYYRVQAKNTVAASVANVAVSIFAE